MWENYIKTTTKTNCNTKISLAMTIGNMHRKVSEIWTCDSEDMLA